MKSNLDEYRTGPIGALLDEHEKAINEFLTLIGGISQKDFQKIIEQDPHDNSDWSIQIAASHVVRAGYCYSNLIRRNHEIETQNENPDSIDSKDILSHELNQMLSYMAETLEFLENCHRDPWKCKIKTKSCGELNLELLLEHSIVHILRHRRQIEKFILKLPKGNL